MKTKMNDAQGGWSAEDLADIYEYSSYMANLDDELFMDEVREIILDFELQPDENFRFAANAIYELSCCEEVLVMVDSVVCDLEREVFDMYDEYYSCVDGDLCEHCSLSDIERIERGIHEFKSIFYQDDGEQNTVDLGLREDGVSQGIIHTNHQIHRKLEIRNPETKAAN